MAKSPEEMLESMMQNLPEKTGKKLTEWLQIIKNSDLAKHSELVKFLKSEHAVTHGYANLIAHTYLNSTSDSVSEQDDLLEIQYAGDKSVLRPLYDELIQMVQRFGEDVKISPKKSYVSLRHNKQFALIQPSTKTRIDIGINLKGIPAKGKLEESGSFNSMVSHRVRISDKNDIDADLEYWLKTAYESS